MIDKPHSFVVLVAARTVLAPAPGTTLGTRPAVPIPDSSVASVRVTRPAMVVARRGRDGAVTAAAGAVMATVAGPEALPTLTAAGTGPATVRVVAVVAAMAAAVVTVAAGVPVTVTVTAVVATTSKMVFFIHLNLRYADSIVFREGG